jgi:hypothetical protein
MQHMLSRDIAQLRRLYRMQPVPAGAEPVERILAGCVARVNGRPLVPI